MNEKKNNFQGLNGYHSIQVSKEAETSDSWREIEKKYFENQNTVLDWEGFKKEYYKHEHSLKQTLDELHKFQIDFSKKISYIEFYFFRNFSTTCFKKSRWNQ